MTNTSLMKITNIYCLYFCKFISIVVIESYKKVIESYKKTIKSYNKIIKIVIISYNLVIIIYNSHIK